MMESLGTQSVEEVIDLPCLPSQELKSNVCGRSLIHVSTHSTFLEGKGLC